MTTHLACVGVLVSCLGAAPPAAAEPTPAQRLWDQGQDALRDGRADEAIRSFEQSLTLDPTRAGNHLSLAAAYLDRGDDERAGAHLAAYLAAWPHHCEVRAHYAELLLRRRDFAAARFQYERFDADAQEQEGLDADGLVHCHSRLMQIAEAQDDDYAAHLHRGIGLYLLAVQQGRLPEEEQDGAPEAWLCKAAGELALAHGLRPDDARPCWYLYRAWSQLAQHHAAARWLRAAADAALFDRLTPAERRSLEMAARGLDAETRRK
jgi:hypothetical protein